MPKTGHRISKHQMKEDSFVTLAFRAQEYIQHNQKYFIGGFVAVVLVVAGTWLWSSAGQRSEIAAENEMGAAFTYVQQKDMAGAAQVYEGVISEYGGTAAAREALFYLANLYFVEKEWQKSIDAYDRWARQHGGSDPVRKTASYAAMADGYRELGEYGQSLEYFEKALNVPGGGFLMADICKGAVRTALQMNDSAKAVEYADRLFDAKGNDPAMTVIREQLALHGIDYIRGL